MDRVIGIGTVRGRVGTISRRHGLRFILLYLLDDAAVLCYPATNMEALIHAASGRIVDVTGTVSRDPVTDRPSSIRDITGIELVEEGSSSGYRAARGVLTATEPAEKLIRQMRDGR